MGTHIKANSYFMANENKSVIRCLLAGFIGLPPAALATHFPNVNRGQYSRHGYSNSDKERHNAKNLDEVFFIKKIVGDFYMTYIPR